MKTFFKKYWINLLFLAIATLLFFSLIPYAEKSYLSTDVYAIRKKTRFVLILTILLLLAIIFILALKNLKTFKEFLNIIYGIVFLGLTFFLVLSPIFSFAGFALNKLYVTGRVEKKFTAVYSDKMYLLLKDLQSGKGIRTEQMIPVDSKYQIHQNDTITLSFKKGLFGFEYDPSFRGYRILPD